MATPDRSTVVGVFQDCGWAERAIDELHHGGFTDREIGILTPSGRVAPALTPTGVLEKNAGDAAVRGAISGGTLGALAGAVATGLIPGVGPVIAGGLLLGILGGAAAGAALGTFAAPFIALGFTEDEARHYQDQCAAGRTILVVRAGDRAAEAREILRRFEGVVREDLPATAAGQAR